MKLTERARRLWLGDAASTPTEDFHESTLEALIVADAIQNAQTVSGKMKVAAVYRGAQLLSDLAAEMPWFAQTGGANSGARANELPERADENPTVLVKPDPFITRGEFIRLIVLSLIFHGNAYLHKSGFVNGLPTVVRVLPPQEVTVSWNASQTLPLYRWRMADVPRSEIDHLALNKLPGSLRGTGPLEAGWATIAGQVAADKFARDLFEGDGVPSGKLMHPGKLNATEAQELLKEWQTAQQAGRKTAVLSGGLDYESISLTPDQAQMLQSRAFGVAEIARFLGVPAHLLNAATGVAGASGANVTYQNVRQTAIELIQMTLQPVYFSRIEEAASGWLPRGQSVAFDFTEFTKPDVNERANLYSQAVDVWLTVDEIRSREGLAPSPELAAEKERKQALGESIAAGGANSQEGNVDASESESRSSADAERV